MSKLGYSGEYCGEVVKYPDYVNKIICGHTLDIIKQLPDEIFDTIVTSCPYWGLRDYGESVNTIWDGDPNCNHKWEKLIPRKYHKAGETNPGKEGYTKDVGAWGQASGQFCSLCGAWYGQLGLEPTLDLYLSHLWQITDELYRVLKKTGVMFWNHGDCYSGGKVGRTDDYIYSNAQERTQGRQRKPSDDIPTKCMCMQNYRLILGMIDIDYRILVEWRVLGRPEGKLEDMLKHPRIQQILRNNIIWNKPNHMPSSVKNRFTSSYEPVFMLTKNNKPQYYYNTKTGLMADKKPKKLIEGVDWDWKIVGDYDGETAFNVRVRDADKGRFIEGATEEEKKNYKKGKRKKVSYWKSIDYWFDLDAVRQPHLSESLIRVQGNWDGHREPMSSYQGMDIKKMCSPSGKNPGDVWTIPTQPFPEAHFATFPEKLIEPMILSSCPQWICKKCGKARVRIVELGEFKSTTLEVEKITRQSPRTQTKEDREGWSSLGAYERNTIGWSDCGCNAGWVAGITFDPFIGSGTTGLVAKKLGRNYSGIELNPTYKKMADKRLMAIPDNLPFDS